MTEERPDWDSYFLSGTEWVSTRADCTRRKVGAIIVKNNRVVATGYNGAYPGGPSCLKGECPRGQLSYDEIPANAPYGNCVAIHAEANAILYCSADDRIGATLYCNQEPCPDCRKLIPGTGIARAVWPGGEWVRT